MSNSYFFHENEKPYSGQMSIFIGTAFTEFGVDGILPEFGDLYAFLPIQDIVKRKKFKRIDQIFNLNEPCCVEINNSDEFGETEQMNCIKKYVSSEDNSFYLLQYSFKKKLAELLISIVEDNVFSNKFIQTFFSKNDNEDWEEVFQNSFNNIYVYLFEMRDLVFGFFKKHEKENDFNKLYEIVNKRISLLNFKHNVEFEICSLKYDGINNIKTFLSNVDEYLKEKGLKEAESNLSYRILYLKTPLFRIEFQSRNRKLLLDLVDEIKDHMENVVKDYKTNIRTFEFGKLVLQE